MPQVENVDPQSEVALSLLREAAFEARQLYPELSFPNVLPTNAPLQEGEIYVVVRVEEQPLACGALRRIDPQTAEVKRIFVRKGHRREGLGRKILDYLQCEARRLGYRRLILETGRKQLASIALYESFGFRRIQPYGEHKNDPSSVCFELCLGPS